MEAVAGPGLSVNEVIASVGQQAELGRAILEPDRRLRPRSRWLRCGGTSRTTNPAARRWWATGALYEAEPSMPILTSGAMPRVSRSPWQSPASDVAGIPFRNVSTPRIRSRLSKTFVTVSSVGIPSKNSRGPIGVSTRSGVRILSGILWL
jgi:hypothetical protein